MNLNGLQRRGDHVEAQSQGNTTPTGINVEDPFSASSNNGEIYAVGSTT